MNSFIGRIPLAYRRGEVLKRSVKIYRDTQAGAAKQAAPAFALYNFSQYNSPMGNLRWDARQTDCSRPPGRQRNPEQKQ